MCYPFHFAGAFAVVGFRIVLSQRLTIQNTISHICSDTSGTSPHFVALNSNANYGNVQETIFFFNSAEKRENHWTFSPLQDICSVYNLVAYTEKSKTIMKIMCPTV